MKRRTHVEAEELARKIHGLRKLDVKPRDIASFLSLSHDLVRKYLSGNFKASIRAGVFEQTTKP